MLLNVSSMNIKHILIASGLLLTIVLMAQCQPKEIDPDSLVRLSVTDTISLAQVRAMTAADAPGKVYLTDAGREGVFVLDLADHSTADNMGTVLVTANGRRYKRQFSGPAYTFWFGVSPTDNDIGPELQTAVNATTGELIIADGQYIQQTEVRMRNNLSLRATPGKVTIVLPKSYVSLVNPVSTTATLENILIEGINWVVTATGAGTYGVITIDGPTINNLTIQQCKSTDETARDSTNFITVKIQENKTGKNIIVRNNDVRAKRMGCEIFNHDNHGIYAGEAIVVSNNTFHECKFGISLSGPLDGLTVEENYIKNCSLYGVEIAGASRNVRIVNNRFEGTFDKFIEGSNDGFGNGQITGGLTITGNQTVGTCIGGIQLFNAGAAQFTNNKINMTGRLEILTTSSSGGTYANNSIESQATHAIICDNAPGNVFRDNTISNKSARENFATFRAYGPRATNISVTGNRFSKGPGGSYMDAVEGASYTATANTNESGQAIGQE